MTSKEILKDFTLLKVTEAGKNDLVKKVEDCDYLLVKKEDNHYYILVHNDVVYMFIESTQYYVDIIPIQE